MIDILFSAQAILGQVLSGRSLSASISGGASSVRLEGRSSAAAKMPCTAHSDILGFWILLSSI